MRAPWPPLLTRLLLALALLLAMGAARADTLESALAPGPLSKAHVKYEQECQQCHVRFDRNAQDRLCADCHKEVRKDIADHTGFHGRQKPQACRSCHTEHKGREVNIAPLDRKAFDHTQTDYALAGKHVQVECAKCHVAGKPWRAAPAACVACHRKDDKHKGSLGDKCADCHTEQSWKDAKFDHAKTRFALTGKHVPAKCDACHANARYKDTPMTCIGCHRADDKQHKGRYGEKCESCHDAQTWKSSPHFHHDTDTRYVLRGKHVKARCDACHTGNLYKDKLATDCLSCHQKDDAHKGSLGNSCESCHVESSWKETGRFDHAKTRFALRDKHAQAKCVDCHANAARNDFKNAPLTCIGCHLKDDKHKANLGEDCKACHTEKGWKIAAFDHDRTIFKLRGAHAAAKVTCASCHKDATRYRNIGATCIACHAKDDKHEGSLGKDCAACHTDLNWRVKQFDHARTRFALLGSHAKVECKSCHVTPRYKDAPRTCIGCHRKDDVHKDRLGPACEDCHNARAWRLAGFDHDKTKFRLMGAHRKQVCEACHVEKAGSGRKIAPLERECIACHRKDDVHEGAFGLRCASCHSEVRWNELTSPRRVFGGSSP